MTEAVDKVLLALKGNNTEKKIEAISTLEDELLEETPLEPQEINQLVPALRDALKGSQQQVSFAALICLNPLVSLISETHPTFLKNVVIAFAAAVIDKLGDNRDKARDAASNVLLTMWESATKNGGNAITGPLATIIKETAYGHKQWRVREQILQWIVTCTRRIPDFSIKQWVPHMVKLLEDPHEQVRETAKDRIVLLFSGAAVHAKSDLKRELEKQSVRPAIVEYISSKLSTTDTNDVDVYPDNVTEPTEEDYMSGGTQNEEISKPIEYVTRPPSSADSEIGVIHVESARELEKEFQNLLAPFSGKESEQNWLIRERGINKLRSLTRGEASQYPDVFVNGLKLLMDGILTSLASLRTTLTLATSGLIKDLASHLKTAIDPFADNLLASLIKMVSSTKKMVANAAANSANSLLQHCSYHARLVTQVWHAMEEKNTQLRTYAIGFVKTVIQAHVDRKDAMERSGGVESLEKCVRKGLTDAAPKVREGCREVFWTFYEVWPDRGEKILKNLEPAVKKKLERDRSRNFSMTPSSTSPITTSSPPRRSTTPAPRNRARSSSMSKSRRLSIPQPDNIASDNHSMPNDSPKTVKESSKLMKPPVTPLRSKSPAPPSMRSKSTNNLSAANNTPSKSNKPTSSQTKKGSPQTQNIQPRELTVIEQLEHSDWNIRIEGLFNVAQSVVQRSLASSPANDFKKSDEELGPVLLNMLNDPTPKVIENFLDPSVIPELARVIRLENLIPRLLLLVNDDSKSEQSIIHQNLFPGVKNAIGSDYALAGLNKCLSLLVPGATQKKSAFTLPQKRKILNGILLWINELIEPKLTMVENDQELTGYLGDPDKYKLLTSRLIPLVTNTKETSENYQPLSQLLINLHKLNPDAFETILFTFDHKVVDLVGNMVGWEEELDEAEEEVLAEEQARLMEEQEREWEQQQLERRMYEEKVIADRKEQLERQQRERELKKQREREAQIQRERELQEQREREIQLQKERELQQQREREMQQQRLRELQLQRQELEIQKQKEREVQKQRELELQQQRELELQQQQREYELQQLELQKQREFELQQQREFELQQQREFELQQQRELEIQQQREAELQQQREIELQQQREYELREREYEREMQSHLYTQRPPPLQLQTARKNNIKDNINDWVENQRAPLLMQRGDDLRNSKEKEISKEQEWARRNRPKTAEPQWPDSRARDIDRTRRTKTPTREDEYERRMYRDSGNWDERERFMFRDTDIYEKDDRYELGERGRRPAKDERSQMLREKTPHKENSWNERDKRKEYEYDEREKRVPRELREYELDGRNQRNLRDSREEEWDGRDRRPFLRGSNQSDSDERLNGKRSLKSSKSTEWDNKIIERPIPRERDLRENDWDEVSSRSSGRERDVRDDWEERSVRSLPRDLRENDWDEKSSQPSPRRDHEWDDRTSRLRPRESRESLEGKNTRPSPRFSRDNDWDERNIKASPRDPRRNDWDERNVYRDNGYPNNKTPERINKGRHRSRDSDRTENTDRPSEGHEEDEDTISEFDLNQSEKSNTKERDHMNHSSKPVGRVVSLPPLPHDLGYQEFDDKDPELANLKDLVEKLDMEEDNIHEENVPENFVDMTISRPTSIYITEDTWAQLANTLNGNVNPFYLNPEERFKNDNNGTDAKLAPLAPIQEDEIAEPTHVEENSEALDDESLQITLPPTSPIIGSDNTLTLSSETSNMLETVEKIETVMEESSGAILQNLQNTDSEIIEETSMADRPVISPKNTVSIPEEQSSTNMPISNIHAVVEPSPASPASSVDSGSSISGARDRALRRAQRFNSASSLPGAAQERRLLLATLLARLHDHNTDAHLFRKLIVISKETPSSNKKLAEDIWENGDRFIELINALMGFLSDLELQNNELKEGAVILLGQLINNQSDYTRGQERDILRVLLECRTDPAVCGQADDILDNYIQIVDANVGLYALIDIMESSLFNTFGSSPLPGSNSPQLGSKTSMKGSAFVVLSKLVKRFDKKSLERQVGSIVPLAIKGFSDPKPEIRKSVVDALVAIYSVIGDDTTLFQYLGSLNAAQQNLLNYYFDKNRKQQRTTSSPSGRGVRV
ncbi:clasp N terminal-domain-containing protein [Glomus cerebriforme]|uniref:Clasp N terminal-domain-containing protein n=1 Tax=Glomus cerebriforme TaxID=658196 RepID=A0A397T9U3_9GLOM|nr:clasp N terminal-domain-containing protein [Glomus cerebriforme]